MLKKLGYLLTKVAKFILSIPKYIGLGFVFGYKFIISPLLPSSCRFTPSCSSYSLTAIRRFGLIKGSMLSAKRILRCNPKNIGGADPVPYNLKGDFKWLI